MPRKIRRNRAYEVVFVGTDFDKPSLGTRDIVSLARILGAAPSTGFVAAYQYILGGFISHAKSVRAATPARVQSRLSAVAEIDVMQRYMERLLHPDGA